MDISVFDEVAAYRPSIEDDSPREKKTNDILEVRNLTKRYGAYQVLKGINLVVRPGEFVALVGPSGCGKTTLLKQIAGFEDPSTGDLLIEGKSMLGFPAALRPTSMVFQKLALFPHMTIAENIGFPLKVRKSSAREIVARVRDMMALMHLKEEYATRYPRQLSGGEQQRVALARSMVSSPKLLLLDEPLSALDFKLKKAMQSELKRLHLSLGVTFVHVTHDLEEAMMLADRICVMRDGGILQLGRPAEIYYRPVNPFVAGFIGETNLFPVTITGRSHAVAFSSPDIVGGDGSLPLDQVGPDLTEGPAFLMVRPELIAPVRPGDPVGATISARVSEMFIKGGTILYRAQAASGLDVIVEMRGTSSLPMRVGDQVTLGWSKKDTFLMAREGS